VTAHSPGPWRAIDGLITDVNGEVVLAFVRESNARLIAAAPELLEVATRAAGMRCLCAATYSDVTQAWDPAGDCAACAARALIRRIEAP
jgi:hypothetical protein